MVSVIVRHGQLDNEHFDNTMIYSPSVGLQSCILQMRPPGDSLELRQIHL